MSVTTKMREYLASVAEWLIDGDDEQAGEEYRARVFREMTADEQQFLNGLVEDIFGFWL